VEGKGSDFDVSLLTIPNSDLTTLHVTNFVEILAVA